MKTIVAALGAGIIAAALLAAPAEARCVSNGSGWHCWQGHNRIDRARLAERRDELRYDRWRVHHLQARLHRDRHFGSSADVRHDLRAVRHARRELRSDRRSMRHAQRGFREEHWGD